MCHESSCIYHEEICTRKGAPCVSCWTECKGPPVQRPPHAFSREVERFFLGNKPSWVQSATGWVPTETGWVQSSWIRSDAPKSFATQWLDDDTVTNPLSKLEKALVSMLQHGVPLQFDDNLNGKPLYTLPRSSSGTPVPVLTPGTTPVPGMPGVRVWVSNATDVLDATGMTVEPYPDEPMTPNTYQAPVTTVYIRFRIEGKLENAGAGYWLAPSLSHLVTSIYVGLAFNELKQHDLVDIGVIRGTRTVIAFPCCYSARVSPDATTWSCKKGNVDYSAQRLGSFRVGDVGVGHPEWVEATKDDGGMNARSQGAGVGHNRLLAIMTELLTTRILQAINCIP